VTRTAIAVAYVEAEPYVMVRVLRLRLCVREGLIAPSPPGVAAVDVQEELGHWPAIGRKEPHGLPDLIVCGFPTRQIVIEEVQSPELFLEQWPDPLEPAGGPGPRR
jgi:hypothetical protein